MSKTKSLLKRRDTENDVKTRHHGLVWDELSGNLITELSDVRRIDGMNLIQALVRNSGTSHSDAKGKIRDVHTSENESTKAEYWGGTTRSSDETFESWWSKGVVPFSFMNRSTETFRRSL
jgi:hypothetical protein